MIVWFPWSNQDLSFTGASGIIVYNALRLEFGAPSGVQGMRFNFHVTKRSERNWKKYKWGIVLCSVTISLSYPCEWVLHPVNCTQDTEAWSLYAVQLLSASTTSDLCTFYCRLCTWDLFVSRRNRRMPIKTIKHGWKDCLLSENKKLSERR